MNELIKITKDPKIGKSTVSARDLYEALEVKGDFTTWCKRMFDYGFTENVDYSLIKSGEPDNQVLTKHDYVLTIDCAKEIAMVQRTDKGKEIRQYFIEIEKAVSAPQTPGQILLAMAQSFADIEARQLATDAKIKELEAKSTITDTNYYTVAGYANLKGIRLDVSKASIVGRMCSKESKSLGYDTGKSHSTNFGTVKSYHLDILKHVFEAMGLLLTN